MDTRACVPCIIAASGHMDMKGRHPGAAKGDMLRRFVQSICEGTRAEVSALEVFEAMNISLSIVESLASGSPVKITNLE